MLPHRRALVIVNNIPPYAIRAAAYNIRCRAAEVRLFAIGAGAVNGPVYNDLGSIAANKNMTHMGHQRYAQLYIAVKPGGELTAVSDHLPVVQDKHSFRGI